MQHVRSVRALAILVVASAAMAGGALPAFSSPVGSPQDASPVKPGVGTQGSAAGRTDAAAGKDASRVLALSTVADLMASMREEAFAYASYSFFGKQAEREKLPRAAKLFADTAEDELNDHFKREAGLADLVGSDESNLRRAIEGETTEALTSYPEFAEQARRDGDTAAAELFDELARDENDHRKALTAALKAVVSGKGNVPAASAARHETVAAGVPLASSPRTRENLDKAMHGEALAHAAYTLFAQHAKDHGHAKVAALFTGLADVELNEHFAGLARQAGLVGTTADNLRASVAAEHHAYRVMYPKFAERARKAGDVRVAEVFTDAAADEARHARAFEQELRAEKRAG